MISDNSSNQLFSSPHIYVRGQLTTLLFQAGIDPEATDLLVIMMEGR